MIAFGYQIWAKGSKPKTKKGSEVDQLLGKKFKGDEMNKFNAFKEQLDQVDKRAKQISEGYQNKKKLS